MTLPAEVRREVRLAAAIRAAADLLNHSLEKAADAGLLVR
jgi:hypothetical protein